MANDKQKSKSEATPPPEKNLLPVNKGEQGTTTESEAPNGSRSQKSDSTTAQNKRNRRPRNKRGNNAKSSGEGMMSSSAANPKAGVTVWRKDKGQDRWREHNSEMFPPSSTNYGFVGEFNPGRFENILLQEEFPDGATPSETLRPPYLISYDLDWTVWEPAIRQQAASLAIAIKRSRDVNDYVPDLTEPFYKALRFAYRCLFIVRSIEAVHGISLGTDYIGIGQVFAQPWEQTRLKAGIETLMSNLEKLGLHQYMDQLMIDFTEPFKYDSNIAEGWNTAYYAKVSFEVVTPKMDRLWMVDLINQLNTQLVGLATGLVSFINPTQLQVPYPTGIKPYRIRTLLAQNTFGVSGPEMFRYNYIVPVPTIRSTCGEVTSVSLRDAGYVRAYVFSPQRTSPEEVLYGVHANWHNESRIALFRPYGFNDPGLVGLVQTLGGNNVTEAPVAVSTYNKEGNRVLVTPQHPTFTALHNTVNARHDLVPMSVIDYDANQLPTSWNGPNPFQIHHLVVMRLNSLTANIIQHEFGRSDPNLNGFKTRFIRAFQQAMKLWNLTI